MKNFPIFILVFCMLSACRSSRNVTAETAVDETVVTHVATVDSTAEQRRTLSISESLKVMTAGADSIRIRVETDTMKTIREVTVYRPSLSIRDTLRSHTETEVSEQKRSETEVGEKAVRHVRSEENLSETKGENPGRAIFAVVLVAVVVGLLLFRFRR